MDTMTALTSWNARNAAPRTGPADLLDRQGRGYNNDRTPVGAVPLRTVAAQQGTALRGALATGRRTPAQVEIEARVAAVKVAQAANVTAPVARPAMASVGNPDRPTYKQINDLSASIPTGFYALPKREGATNANQPTYHFKIHKFRGGHRIVMVTGGVGAFVEVPMKAAWQWVALQKIAADPKAAAVLFGRETGTCGRCSSPLTNAASRAAGLGPTCRKAY